MSVIRLPYEPRTGPKRGRIDEMLAALILLRLMKRDWLILDPMAGERTIEKVGRELGFNVISYDIRNGVDARALPLADESVDVVIVDPPYWRATKYTGDPRDLSNARTYSDYLSGLKKCLKEFHGVFKRGDCWS